MGKILGPLAIRCCRLKSHRARPQEDVFCLPDSDRRQNRWRTSLDRCLARSSSLVPASWSLLLPRVHCPVLPFLPQTAPPYFLPAYSPNMLFFRRPSTQTSCFLLAFQLFLPVLHCLRSHALLPCTTRARFPLARAAAQEDVDGHRVEILPSPLRSYHSRHLKRLIWIDILASLAIFRWKSIIALRICVLNCQRKSLCLP